MQVSDCASEVVIPDKAVIGGSDVRAAGELNKYVKSRTNSAVI